MWQACCKLFRCCQSCTRLASSALLRKASLGQAGKVRKGCWTEWEELCDKLLHVCLFHVHRSTGKAFLDVCSAICQNGTGCVVAETCLNALRGGTTVTEAQESVSCNNYCNILPLLFPPCFLSAAALIFFFFLCYLLISSCIFFLYFSLLSFPFPQMFPFIRSLFGCLKGVS